MLVEECLGGSHFLFFLALTLFDGLCIAAPPKSTQLRTVYFCALIVEINLECLYRFLDELPRRGGGLLFILTTNAYALVVQIE